MNSSYLADEEYEMYWVRLEGMREAISRDLRPRAGMKVLDVGTGWGFFAIEVARRMKKGEIVGIDISSEGVNMARNLARKNDVADIFQVMRMDATRLFFPDDCFHLTTSFLGMRDIHMTRGETGVRQATKEMIRVTKPGGRIVLCITPLEDMETEDQRLAVEVEGRVFGAESLPKRFYTDLFREDNVALRDLMTYYTHKKLTASHARTELREGTEIARKIYGKVVPDFEEVWNKYGEKIETSGYGMYSKIVMLAGEKMA